jgi:hypothetical protein
MVAIKLRDYLHGFNYHKAGTIAAEDVNHVYARVEDDSNTDTVYKVVNLTTAGSTTMKAKFDGGSWTINTVSTSAGGETLTPLTGDVTPMLNELVKVFNSDITIDIFMGRVGEFVSVNSPTTDVNTFYSVIDKFALFLDKFGDFIDYEGTFGNDYATLKTKTDAVESAFATYTSGVNPYPQDASGLLTAITDVKTHVHTVIYPKCKIVNTNNLKGALQAAFTELKNAVDENVAADTLVTMPDENVCEEFGVQ